MIYTLPILARCDWESFLGAWGFFVLGSLFVVFNTTLWGWGHSLFHLAIIPFSWYMLEGMADTRWNDINWFQCSGVHW